MKKYFIVITCIVISAIAPHRILAAWTSDDASIQKVNQDKVPQVNQYGQIQDSYNQDSFFPLILYFTDMGAIGQPWTKFNLDSTKSRDTLPEVQSAGFNASWPSWFTPTTAELDHAKQYNVKIIANLSNEITVLLTGGKTPDKISAFKSTVARLRDHSSVIGYHLYDEFPAYTPEQYLEIKNLIREVDPHKIVFANHYQKGCTPLFDDISNFDVYPFKSTGPTTTLLQTGAAINSTLASGCPRPAWVIIQSFQDNKYSWRVPTPLEMRGQIYTAIAHGATGIYAFMQHSPWAWNTKNGGEGYLENKEAMAGISPQVNGNLWQEISKINHEITTYNKVFLSQTSQDIYHLFNATGSSVHTLLKDTGEPNTRYLLAVNIYNTPTSEKFIFASPPSSTTSLLDNRVLTPTNNEFTDNFTPFGVRLYKINFGTTTFNLADFNMSGKVDLADYNLLLKDFGTKFTIFDYNLLVANFDK